MIDDTILSDLTTMFFILGDSSRLKIVIYLLNHLACVSDIIDTVKGKQSTVSHQLKVLRNASILSTNKIGQKVYYQLKDDCVKLIVETGLKHYLGGHDNHE